jgi:peptidoglycan/xylan/chitin deacetylase (PgdA/CDA1 family)
MRTLVRDSLILLNGALRGIVGPAGGRRVIAFHDARDQTALKRRLVWLAERHRIVSIEELLCDRSPDDGLALTFDDGDVSWHEIVAPTLIELGLPATFFVSSGFVGLTGLEADEYRSRRLRRTRDLQPLSRQQLLDLAQHGSFEVAGHTSHHVDLGEELSDSRLRGEIHDDKKRLEDWTGRELRWFAYPFGGRRNLNARSRAAVREAGYAAGFTIVPGFLDRQQDRYALGRDCLDEVSSDALWSARLRGGYDFHRHLGGDQ